MCISSHSLAGLIFVICFEAFCIEGWGGFVDPSSYEPRGLSSEKFNIRLLSCSSFSAITIVNVHCYHVAMWLSEIRVLLALSCLEQEKNLFGGIILILAGCRFALIRVDSYVKQEFAINHIHCIR